MYKIEIESEIGMQIFACELAEIRDFLGHAHTHTDTHTWTHARRYAQAQAQAQLFEQDL